MAELNIADAIERISSSAQKERSEGLADLKHILQHNRRTSKKSSISDKSYHTLYEALFKLASTERAQYVKATRPTTKSGAAKRLDACAETLRLAVEIGVRTIRTRTVKAVLEHIMHTLPVPGGGYCQPLLTHYLKCIQTILEYQPHVEHLSKPDWRDVAEFCLNGIKSLEDTDSISSNNSNGLSSFRTPEPSVDRNSRSESQRREPRDGGSSTNAQELVICLRFLLTAPNAPVNEVAETALSTLVAFLESFKRVGRAHQDALAAINSVLGHISFENINVTKTLIRQILPIVKDLWLSRTAAASKDELLIVMLQSQEHLASMVNAEGDGLLYDVEGLIEAFRNEYGKRQDREQLQVDDLYLRHEDRLPWRTPFQARSFVLRPNNSRAESHWTLLYLISYLSDLVFSKRSAQAEEDDAIAMAPPGRPRKRHRSSDPISEYLRDLLNQQSAVKVSALQIIAFMAHRTTLNEDGVHRILDRLTTCVSDKNPKVSSWALLCISALAFQDTAKGDGMLSFWSNIWQIASRNITSPSSSRAACHVLDTLLRLKLVKYTSIAETIENIVISIDMNGPATLADSSVSLFCRIIQEAARENPSSLTQLSERIINWFFAKWAPSSFGERNQSIHAMNVDTSDLLRLVGTCLDRNFMLGPSPFIVLGPVGQAASRSRTFRSLARYLLLLDGPDGTIGIGGEDLDSAEKVASSFSSRFSSQPFAAIEAKILDSCTVEVQSVSSALTDWLSERPQNITQGMLRLISALSIVSSSMAYVLRQAHTKRTETLQKYISTLTKSIVRVVGLQESSHAPLDGIFEALSSVLPLLEQLGPHEDDIWEQIGIAPLALRLTRSLQQRKANHDQSQSGVSDIMDIDEEFGSQQSRDPASSQTTEYPRSTLAAQHDIATFRACITSYIHFIGSLFENTESAGSVEVVPQGFIDYLDSLPDRDFLSSRPFVNMVVSSSFQLRAEAVDQLLVRMGDSILALYENNHCELALAFCIEFMTRTSGFWTDSDNDAAYNNGADIYEWFVGTALQGGFVSPFVQVHASEMFYGILKTKPDYAKSLDGLPSVRTSLFGLLQDGNIIVKYHVGCRLSAIFENFILSRHEDIFDDIFESIPKDSDWEEGIALRLLILSKLGGAWHTLLRRCVYHIYETAGLLAFSTKHAEICFEQLSTALELENPQVLFSLFAPQLLYTWLENQDLDSIPYSIFKYESLVALLEDAQDEILGQAMMRGQQNHVNALCSFLKVAPAEMLKRNFGKSAAYCISWDVSLQKKSDQTSEAAIRKLVGKEQSDSLMRAHFPRIIGTMFLCMDQLRAVQKGFSQDAQASTILEEIQSISASTSTLPADQQPSFNSRFLIAQITRLAHRVGYKLDGYWTPGIFVFVMRMLLSRIVPALGSLHACSIIRKIRVLVSVAGEVALSGYPLQMALHSLRPFLTDSQCADDALGIVQYLFHHGNDFLTTEFSFMTGIGLSTLMSLRVFLSSSQESTTQESQFRATMSKAQAFHSWFSMYLEGYVEDAKKASTLSKRHYEAFKTMMATATDIRTEGNSFKDTPESRLLLALLDDDRSGRKLLSEPAQNLAFSLLCQNFKVAPSSAEDILGSDEHATKFAAQVLKVCRRGGIGEGYLVWAARVLGRTFGAQGEIKDSLRKTMRQIAMPVSGPTSQSPRSPRSSRSAILDALSDLLFSDKGTDAGLAEETLRIIMSRSAGGNNSQDIEASLPAAAITALSLSSTDQLENRRPVSAFSVKDCAFTPTKPVAEWIRDFSIALAQAGFQDPVLGALPRILLCVSTLGEHIFPYLLHLILSQFYDDSVGSRGIISEAFNQWFQHCDMETVPHVRILLKALVYLRTQQVPREQTRVDRDKWLYLDYIQAAAASAKCGLHRIALLFVETYTSKPQQQSRRTSSAVPEVKVPVDLQLSIYRNLDEPDSYYGVEQVPTLSSILNRLEYEGDGAKGLFFRGARMDSQMRRLNKISSDDSRGMLQSLTMLNLNSVTHSLLKSTQVRDIGEEAVNSLMYTARKLENWDIRAAETNMSEAGITFKAFQSINNCMDVASARGQLNSGFSDALKTLLGTTGHVVPFESYLRTLAVLNEMDELLGASTAEQLQEAWDKVQGRNSWMDTGRLEDLRPLLSCRETFFSILSQNENLQTWLHASPRDTRRMEANALLSSSKIYRKHGALQESLASATYLLDIAEDCKKVGYPVTAAAQFELADVLWCQGETDTSIRMLQHLLMGEESKQLSADLGLCQTYTKLGTYMAAARLENPDEIIRKYLTPAIQELKGATKGHQAGQAFHTFASFCDTQLSNGEIDEDIQRTFNQAQRKSEDAREFDKLMRDAKGAQRDLMRGHARRSKKVAEIDMQEYHRLRGIKETFLRQCLENYLLALQACDDYDNDVLRVFALWLEFSNTSQANEAMSKHLASVPSGKFAIIMNQLSSRLQAEQSDFQTMLSDLVFRICLEHPYHSLHHIFSGIMSLGVRDESARSRNAAAKEISSLLRKHERSRRVWAAVHNSDELYHEMALTTKEDLKGLNLRELTLDKFSPGRRMIQKIPPLKVPPATASIQIRPDGDYSNVPVITNFRSRVSIAGGLSAPKIVRVMASDGVEYRQLFKSGSDDLRQDAIMEQVFEHSSSLLKKHTATRIRDLHIRTYKVLPLSARSGVIEFVQNTISLADILIPMHQRYNPKDYRSDQCRKIIEDAQKSGVDIRVKEFRRVMDHFSPVMRYFFLERFENPDEWFESRLAYTRTTAAISILGWVLGLGDRHCQNILLDERTGEVVHIDLGVAFEMGRILPVPELVPFRLTRDLVDAMGYTKTEGVFRRCCEFTLDTLREESESIMILLNVLRYDPLVNWSIPPLKAKRMQEQQDQQQPEGPVREYDEDKLVEATPKRKENEGGDAGRALAVVEKKLSKTLSTAATVSGLIQQATDVRNLAVLFCGWAAHC